MNTLMNANIFFFVTTIATIIFVILGSIALVYVIKILRAIKRETDAIESRIESASERMDAIGDTISRTGIFQFLFPGAKKRRHTKAD